MALAIVDTGEAHSATSVSSVTRSTTLTAGVNLLLVFANNFSTRTVTSLTFNGASLTSKGSIEHSWFGNVRRVELFYLVSPATGSAYDLIATWSSAEFDLGFTFVSVSDYGSLGTFYSNSPATNGTSADGTVTISDWASGDISIGTIHSDQSVTAGDTLAASYVSAGNNDCNVNTEYTTADGNLNWTNAARPWAACGCAIKPAAGGVTWLKKGYWYGQVYGNGRN